MDSYIYIYIYRQSAFIHLYTHKQTHRCTYSRQEWQTTSAHGSVYIYIYIYIYVIRVHTSVHTHTHTYGHTQDKNGNTPLHMALGSRNHACAEVIAARQATKLFSIPNTNNQLPAEVHMCVYLCEHRSTYIYIHAYSASKTDSFKDRQLQRQTASKTDSFKDRQLQRQTTCI